MEHLLSIGDFRRAAKAGHFKPKRALTPGEQAQHTRPVVMKDVGGLAVALEGADEMGFDGKPIIDLATRSALFRISDSSEDRDKDTLNVNKWVVAGFNRNGPFLFAHGLDPTIGEFPVGQSKESPFVKDGGLYCRCYFTTADINPDAERVWKAVQDKLLVATSVGFIPLDWDYPKDPERGYGMDILEQELVEISILAVPSNRSALLQGKGGLKATKPETDADEAGDELHAQLAEHVKSLGEHCAVMADHAKAAGKMREELAKTLADAQEHTKALGEHVKALTEDAGDDVEPAKDDKAAAPSLKGGAPHKLSVASEKCLKQIEKAAASMRSLHDGQGAAENDDGPEPDADDKSAKAAPGSIAAWMEKLKAPAPSSEALPSELQKVVDQKVAEGVGKALRKARGKLD